MPALRGDLLDDHVCGVSGCTRFEVDVSTGVFLGDLAFEVELAIQRERIDATAQLEQRDGAALSAGLADGGVAAARRWFTSFGSCSITEPLDDLIALGLVEDPA